MTPYVWLVAKVSTVIVAFLVASPRLGVATALALYVLAIMLMLPRQFAQGAASGACWLGVRLAGLAAAALLTGVMTGFRWTSPISGPGVVVVLVLIAAWALREAKQIRTPLEPARS